MQDNYEYPIGDAAAAAVAVEIGGGDDSESHPNWSFEEEDVNSSSNPHTDGKLYACDRCDSTFSLMGNLRRHYIVHSGSFKKN